MNANIEILQDSCKDDERIKLVSPTVSLLIDSFEQLLRYPREYDVNPIIWHLVTGYKKEIYELARNSYFVENEIGLQLSTDDFLHTENFILVDYQGHIHGIYNGTILNELERIKSDISSLINH